MLRSTAISAGIEDVVSQAVGGSGVNAGGDAVSQDATLSITGSFAGPSIFLGNAAMVATAIPRRRQRNHRNC